MRIRLAEETDRPFLHAAFQALLQSHEAFDQFYVRQQPDGTETFSITDNVCLVAETAAGEPIGMVFGTGVINPKDRAWPYALMKALWVEPASRGQGIGTALVAAYESRLKAAGAVSVDLHVDVRNADVVALYERLGYETYQVRKKKLL